MDAKDELRVSGFRATPGRLALLEILRRANKPLSIKEMLHYSALDQVSLYRALDALVAVGLVRKGVQERVAHFEYAAKPHHHHLVCADCGFIRDCKTC